MTDLSDVVPRFSTIERVLFDRLNGRPHVNIDTLFRAAFDVSDTDRPTPRRMQQRLGPYVRSMNLKLVGVGWRVVPGEPRRTYALQAFNPKLLAKQVKTAAATSG